MPILVLALLALLASVCAAAPAGRYTFASPRASSYQAGGLGYIHGAQYWLNPSATPASIEDEFRRMAEEDHLNTVRLAFWGMAPGRTPDFTLWDVCFAAAARHGIRINVALPQIPGWIDGGADDPAVRQTYREHIQTIVRHYRDAPALGWWTVDIEPSRNWRVAPNATTLGCYHAWLKTRYGSLDEFRALNPGLDSFDAAYAVKAPGEGPWNNYQPYLDWLSFSAWTLAEQVRFVSEAVKEVDPVHPTSSTPPDVLQNQPVANGRSMWWLADAVDVPSCQLETHWHLETGDMPVDVLTAQAASIRKLHCSARGRPTYSGEMLAGPDLGESPRLYSPPADELLASTLVHLGEGSQGVLYWLWNPLQQGPNAGCWSLRNLDGSPSDRSRLLARFGQMVSKHGALLARVRPADTHVAILDTFDAAVYLNRRSVYHPMWVWYAQNQYGLFKALRKCNMGCDFIDESGLKRGDASRYACLYVPFSICLTEELGGLLRQYVSQGGTIVADALTAFTPPNHDPYRDQPGAGLAEVFGLRACAVEMPASPVALQTFGHQPSPLLASHFLHAVEPTTARVLFRDARGRPTSTVNDFGRGHALWTGTLLGLNGWPHDTPPARYEAVADLFRPRVPATPWRLDAPSNTITCRHLSDAGDDLYVLINEAAKAARFTLHFGHAAQPQELLWPDAPSWRPASRDAIGGELAPLGCAVVHCHR